MDIQSDDLDALREAKALLTHPGIAARITGLIGMPVEKGFAMLPDNWQGKIGRITQASLTKAVKTAVMTMKAAPGEAASSRWHQLMAAASGGIGGFFGLAALAVELPISTTIMLRSIADIARSEGEPIREIGSQLACLEVFALGGTDDGDDAGYFAVRAALSQAMRDAARHLSRRGLTDTGAPALVRLIVLISKRFGIQVSEKVAAQAIPAIGAAGGAVINTLFINHFQDVARGHFTVRRLERRYGHETIASVFEAL